MLIKKTFFIVFFSLFIAFDGFSQADDDSLYDSAPKSLKEYRQRADELYNGFKNGPAFEYLQKFGDLKEKEYSKQMTDEKDQIESKFKIDFSRRQQELKDILTEIDTLKKENDSLEKEKQKLTRNTILFFFILVSFLAGVLISRMKLSKKAQSFADTSSVQLNRTLKLSEIPGHVGKINSDTKSGFQSVSEISSESLPLIAKLKSIAVNQKKNTESFQKLETSLNKVQDDAKKGVLSAASVEKPGEETPEEKITTNLNNIINEAFEVSFYWIKSFDESFDCGKVKDLEKILPEINIMPVAISTALFHFFNNAFYAVYERKKAEGKNFEPKISVTSRKLPRFVQVRIKDNGFGIDDKVLPKIYEPFFTTKPPQAASGLGLSAAAEIIKKKHGGEIIIESEPGKGTDFIIRFPLNTPM